MRNIEAVATDLDSTVLLPSPYEDRRDVPPTERVFAVLERLRAADIPVIAVTSRSESLMRGEVIESLNLRDPCVLDGGATLYDPQTRQTIEQRWLPSGLVRGVVGALGELCMEVYCDPEGRKRTSDDLGLSLIAEDTPSIFMVFNREHQANIAAELADSPDNLTYHFNSMDGSDTVSCVQITAQGVTKLSGLYRALKRVDVDPSNAMGIGDGPADAEFISAMGVSAVMGNASLEMLAMVEYGAVITPSVKNDGFPIAVERQVFGEEGPLIKKRHRQWRDGDRLLMQDAVRDRIIVQLKSGEPLADAEGLNRLVDKLSAARPIDSWQAAVMLTECLGDNQELALCDLDLLRPCKGIEHSSGVSGVFEEHYAPFFYHDTEALAAMRLALLLQDIGKALSVAVVGDSFSQARFNAPVVENIVKVLDGASAERLKTAVRLLAAIDFVGDVMKASEEDADQVIYRTQQKELAELREAWPEGFSVPLEDCIIAMYLSDAGAHTRYAAQMNAETGSLEWAVIPEDAQLSFLFEQRQGDILTLRPDLARRLVTLLPDAQYMRDALGVPTSDDAVRLYGESMDEVDFEYTVADAVHFFREDLRLILVRGIESEAITEMDASSDNVITLEPSRGGMPTMMSSVLDAWVHLPDKADTSTLQPSMVSRPFVRVVGADLLGIPITARFYIRGGRIWLKTESGVSDPLNKFAERAMDSMDRTDALRRDGVRGLAAYESRIAYGRPLNVVEVADFLDWFGMSDVLWAERE